MTSRADTPWRAALCPALFSALALATGLLTPAWATPAQVWRCDVTGQVTPAVTYSDRPCQEALPAALAATATQRSVAATDPRTAQQQRDAQAVARSDENLLQRLQQERRQREIQTAKPGGAAVIGLAPDPLAQPSLKARSPQARQQPLGGLSAARTSPTAAPASRRGPG